MGTRYRGSGRDFIFAWELLLKLSTNIPIFFPYRTINTKYFKKRNCSVSILMMICGWNCLKVSSFRKVLYFFPVLWRIWCDIFRRFIISREFHGRWIYDPLRGGRNSTLPISHILEFLKRKSLARHFSVCLRVSDQCLSVFVSTFVSLRDETPFPAESKCD